MARSNDEIQLGPQGRLVVPAALRRQPDLNTGERLLIRVKDGALILEPRGVVERRLRDRFCTVDPHISLADSLIADRRAEVAREEASP